MRKFWVFMGIMFAIVLTIALLCAWSDEIKAWFAEAAIYIFGGIAVTVGGWAAEISANPVYQQWHMLIWFIGGIIGTVIFTKILWPRLHQTKQVTQQEYQHTMSPSIPQSTVEAVPQNIAKAETEKKESVPV